MPGRIIKKLRSGSATIILGVFFILAFFAFIMMFMEVYQTRENYLTTKAATDTIADGTALYAMREDEATIDDIKAKAVEISDVIGDELDEDIGLITIDNGDFADNSTITVSTKTSFPRLSGFFSDDAYSVQTVSATKFSPYYIDYAILGIAPISGSGTGVDVAKYAVQFVGNPYVWGGTSLTNGCDCSGFIMSVYAHFGVSLPHSSYSLRFVGHEVSPSEMAAGDIICFDGHCGIYIGNNLMVHAQSSKTGIVISSYPYHKQTLAIRRIFDE